MKTSEEEFAEWWDKEWKGERESNQYKHVRSISFFVFMAGIAIGKEQAAVIAETKAMNQDNPGSRAAYMYTKDAGESIAAAIRGAK